MPIVTSKAGGAQGLTDAARLAALFAGNEHAHGTHGQPEKEGLKWSVNKTAKTLREGPTPDMWARHVAGEQPLGVVPIRADSTCSWGSIDFDEYDADVMVIVAKIGQAKYPLVPCRSKSGGLHLFLFLEKPEPAADVQTMLRRVARMLDLSDAVEIFPKQTEFDAERGDAGSWMVMPYFGGDFAGKLRMQHGLKKTGAEMTLHEFVTAAEKMRTATAALDKLLGPRRQKNHHKESDLADFSDGPPCLQRLTSTPMTRDGRKRVLFMMALYCKRAYPEDWKEKLKQKNETCFHDPLPVEYVNETIKSAQKKDYQYTCKQEPMKTVCDAGVCRLRPHGVGTGDGYLGDAPYIESWLKIDDPEEPTWFIKLRGIEKELEITDARDINDYKNFQNQCSKQVDKYFPLVPPALWATIKVEAQARLEIRKPDKGLTIMERFREQLEQVLTERGRADTWEGMLDGTVEGKPFLDVNGGVYYFTLARVETHLSQIKFFYQGGRKKLGKWIRDLGGWQHNDGNPTTILQGKQLRLWCMPEKAFQVTPPLVVPRIKPVTDI